MAREERRLLLLFDGNALVHRAFHALPPLTQPKTGELVNAVYGFASTLLKVFADFKPTHWAVAFDRPTPTFRHEMFEEYKAQRPATPEELKSQIKKVHQLVEAFHIPVFEIDGFEADDILGTLSKQADEQGIETIIVTGDNDMLQAVLPRVKILVPRRAFADTILYDEKAVEEKYGIRPEQLPDLKALVGDVSDNIPGLSGVGEKTATKLLQQYGSLQGIYDHIEDVTPGRLQDTLRKYRTQAFRNKELSTIIKSVPIKLDLKTCQVSHYDRNEVARLFQELEFIKLLSRLPQVKTESFQSSAVKCHTVNTDTALEQLTGELEEAQDLAIEVEATSEKAVIADLVGIPIGIGISPSQGKAFYIPLGHQGLNQPPQLLLNQVTARLKPILENASIGKIAYNGKHVMAVLAGCGIKLENLNFDPMLAAYLLGEKSLGLKELAFNKLGVEISTPAELNHKGKRRSSLSLLEVGQVADYACVKVNILWSLREDLQAELRKQGLWQLFTGVEMALIPVLVAMERNGILLDTDLLRQMSLEMGRELLKLEKEIYSSVGHQFNINSSQQLGRVLFEELKLPQSRRTKTGYSTEASVMEALRDIHPVIELVLKYRQLSKLKSTYIDALPALINHKTGRVHTSFNQTGTATGRLSSSDPNLQNIPIRSEMGNKIRKAIIAPPGAYLLSADYSQIDLRVLAHLSQDPGLIAAFARGEDIHATTASKIFGIPVAEVTPEMRRNAKTVNFGVVYGMSDYGLEQATNLSREEAAQFISLYFEKYPGVKKYLEATKEQARKLGYVQTILGRRRFLPEITSTNRMVREAAERMAINAPVQGSSADIIKIAMINLHREMERRNLKSKMLLQIHDELLFEVPEKEVEEMKSLADELMPRAVELSVPVKIDIKLGRNWGEMR
ncbi:MAG: DNA polymerase I [Chloroflexi bacterium]|nr:MAG: DNA polymerase I [Chloroflexota bacterium]